VEREGERWKSSPKFFSGFYSTKPPTMQNFVAISKKMPEISAIKNLCSQKKWAKVHQKILGDATPQDLPSCQISSRLVKPAWRYGLFRKKFPHTHTYIHVTHTRHPDYLNRARGATKNYTQCTEMTVD